MKVSFSPSVLRAYSKLKKEQPTIEERFENAIVLFAESPHHLSLRNHKLKGNLSGYRAIRINNDIPAVFHMTDRDEALFTDIGDHEEVY